MACFEKKTKSRSKNWTEGEIKVLINIWKDHHNELLSHKRNRPIYEKIANELKLYGLTKNASEVQVKIKILSYTFRREKIISKTEGSPSTWKFFSQVGKIVGSLPCKNSALKKDNLSSFSLNESTEFDDINCEEGAHIIRLSSEVADEINNTQEKNLDASVLEKDIDVEKLIKAVQERPAIWDLRDSAYRDDIKRKHAWKEIVEIMARENSSFEEKETLGALLIDKWKLLQDRFSTLAATSQKSGNGGGKKTPYIFAKLMAFLCDVIDHKETNCNSEKDYQLLPPSIEISSPETSNSNNLPSSQDQTGRKRRHDTRELPSSQDQTRMKRRHDTMEELPFSQDQTRRKRRHDTMEELPFSQDQTRRKGWHDMMEERFLSVLEKLQKTPGDDDEYFLLSLLPMIKSIPEDCKLDFRVEVMQLIRRFRSSSA